MKNIVACLEPAALLYRHANYPGVIGGGANACLSFGGASRRLFICAPCFFPSILLFSFWLAKLICPNLPLARGAAAAALSPSTPWVEKTKRGSAPGRSPPARSTQPGATAAEPTGHCCGLSLLLRHCESQNPPSTNPSKPCTLTLSLSSPQGNLPPASHKLLPGPAFIPVSVALPTSLQTHPSLPADPTTQPLHHCSPFSVFFFHTPCPTDLFFAPSQTGNQNPLNSAPSIDSSSLARQISSLCHGFPTDNANDHHSCLRQNTS